MSVDPDPVKVYNKVELIAAVREAKPGLDKKVTDSNHYLADIVCDNCRVGKIKSFVIPKGERIVDSGGSISCPLCGVKGEWVRDS